MRRQVVLFDTDSTRAADVRTVLQQGPRAHELDVCTAATPSELRRLVAQGRTSVVFADVRSRAGALDGIAAARDALAQGGGTQVVLLGVREGDLVRANEVDHAYLLPTTASEDDLLTALDRALYQLDRWLERPLMVRTRRRDLTISPSKVRYVESDRRKIRIHVGSEVVEAYGKLSELLVNLPNRFVQCHKSFVVNLGFIEELDRESVVLTTGEHVPVSQKRRKETREAFLAYVGRVMESRAS